MFNLPRFCLSLFFLTALSLTAQEPEKILYIRGEFKNKPMGLSDAKWLKQIKTLHGTLTEYWKIHSYGKIKSLEATYTPILVLSGKTDDYFKYDELAKGMRRAAAEAGFPAKNYDHTVYLYPSIKHNISFGGLGGGGEIWLPGPNPYDGGLIHEFGHSLGLGHANSIEGENKVIFPGERREGRDGLHMMGSDGHGRHGPYSTINLPMRYALGFVKDKHIKVVKADGLYRIFEYEIKKLPETGYVGARLKVNKEDFWISFAPKMKKRWSNFRSENFGKGIIVHRRQGWITDLLDFSPGSGGKTKNEEDYVDTRDGALEIGKSFLFPNSTVTITPVTVGKDVSGLRYIDVSIKMRNSDTIPFGREVGRGRGSVEHQGSTVSIKAKSALSTRSIDSCFYYSCRCEDEKDTIAATVTSFLETQLDSQAGVMMRSGEGSQVPQVSVMLSGSASVAMLWRSSHGQSNEIVKVEIDPSTLKAFGLRLTRNDKMITGEYSVDGESWITIKTVQINAGSELLKGLAVSSGNPKVTVTTKFDEVNLVQP